MSLKLASAALAFTVLFSTGSAYAYDRHFDFGQVWNDSVRAHQRDEALSATPRDVMRRHPTEIYGATPHDPSGRIILEGAK